MDGILFYLAVLMVIVACVGMGVWVGGSVRHGKGKRTTTTQGKYVPYDPRAPWKGGYYE